MFTLWEFSREDRALRKMGSEELIMITPKGQKNVNSRGIICSQSQQVLGITRFKETEYDQIFYLLLSPEMHGYFLLFAL